MAHGGDIYRNKVNIDYSVNLNPVGTPDEVLEAVKASIGKLSEYPDIEQEEVRRIIAANIGLESGYVFAGSGASELIMAVVRAINPKRALLFEPSFSGYEYALNAVDCEIVHHRLSEEKGFAISDEDLEALDESVDMVFLCDPANPTGLNVQVDILAKILDKASRNNTFVCLDESFYLMSDSCMNADVAGRSDLVKKYANLFIVRSLTKLLAMPGVRMGYAVSSPDNIDAVRKQLPEWNLSIVAEAAIKSGFEVIGNTDFVPRTNAVISEERTYLIESLKALGLEVFESNTAFIMFQGPEILGKKLLERGVLIRDCSDFEGLRKGFFRIAVRNHEDNREFIQTVRGVMNGV